MARFIDAPNVGRCMQTITLRDGTKAQCGRRGTAGGRCWQHQSETPRGDASPRGEGARPSRVLSVCIHRPGRAKLIADNGWPCAHPGCPAEPTVEVEFIRSANGPAGYSVGSHGTCEAHAEDHARALQAPAQEPNHA